MTALPDDVTGLLTAIRDALALPLPATSEGHEERTDLLHDRAAAVTGALDAVLKSGAFPSSAAGVLRNRIAKTPVTYPTEEAP